MKQTINPGSRCGSVSIPASKSFAHRLLICAALSEEPNTVICDGISKDVQATIDCLRALGAVIEIRDEKNLKVEPVGYFDRNQSVCPVDLGGSIDGIWQHRLPCNESGSTLRFLLPVAGALGLDALFEMAPGLAARPMDALINELARHGVRIKKEKNIIVSEGRLQPGRFEIPGNISSQYISGFLFALPLLKGDSELIISGNIESGDYIKMTEEVIQSAGIRFDKTENGYRIPGNQKYMLSGTQTVEQDWSNAAFFLCMGALSSNGITVNEMQMNSTQGDCEIVNVLCDLGAKVEVTGSKITVKKGSMSARSVDASTIPDLVPTISALAAVTPGTTQIINAGRLRFKESDRLKTTAAMLKALGADVEELSEGLIIRGRERLKGGVIDAANDHRIAMAAAVAACGCDGDVIVPGAECVEKSYPKFWEHFNRLEVEA